MNKNLYELVYMSVSTKNLSSSELEALLKKAQQFNKKNNITGCLIYNEKTHEFIQHLEGDQEVLLDLFDQKIAADKRHTSVEICYSGETKERLFKDWSMAFQSVSSLEKLDGFSEFFDNGFNLITKTGSKASLPKKFFVKVAESFLVTT